MRKNKGFTLIEVLISTVILSIGILGVLNLQTRALMDSQDAYMRTQAIFLAYDMSDRIRANGIYWQVGSIPTPAHSSCSAYDVLTSTVANCTSEQVAKDDYYRWKEEVASILPDGSVTVESKPDPILSSGTNPITRLTISWTRVNQDIATKLGTAKYSLDVRP